MTGVEAALSHVNGWSGSSHNMYYKPADIAEVASFNVHLRGGSGYRDENSGQVVTKGAFTRLASPALDAGDPAAKCVEPVPNGWRVNLGYYGNTPWATLSRDGTLILVR